MSESEKQNRKDANPKKRVRRRKPGARDNLAIVTQPHFARREGKHLKRYSAEQVLLQQQYDRAAMGNTQDLDAILSRDRDNQKAIAWHTINSSPDAKLDRSRAMEAGLILDIFRLYDVERQARFTAGWKLDWFDPYLRISPWAVAAQRRDERFRRVPAIYDELDKHLERFAIPACDGRPSNSRIRELLLAALRTRRGYGGQFQPGICPNQSGRGGSKPWIELPFPWLEQRIIVPQRGRDVEMTRSEALIYVLQRKALEDVQLARRFNRLLMKYRKTVWRPETKEQREDREMAEGLMAQKLPRTIYDAARFYGLVSARAKKSVLFEPWLVELALGRLDRKLDAYEQKLVVGATARPHGEFWPEWWIERPCPGRPRVKKQNPAGVSGRIVRV